MQKKFYRSITSKKNSDKQYEHTVKVWNALEMKQ